MKAMEYLRSLVKAGTLDSSKSFALVVSVLVGALVGVCVCFCLVWDVVANGHVETDLDGKGGKMKASNKLIGKIKEFEGYRGNNLK